MNKLRVPPLDAQIQPSVLFKLGLWSGMLAVCLVALILGAIFVDITKVDRAAEVLRLFRFGFIILLMAFLVGLNFHGFRKAGVNHVLIFEVNPRDNLAGFKIMETSALLATVWMVCALLYVYLDLAAVPIRSRLSIPIAPCVLLALFFVNPFHIWLYSSRVWLLKRLKRIFLAPFYYVEFADFWLADQLNSIVISLGDLEYLICFYIFDWDRDPFIDHNNLCGTVAYGIRPIILVLPAWFRFAQCLRRYADTRDAHPHLFNAGKYSTTFFVVLFSALVSREKGLHDGVQQYSYLFVLWVLSALISTTYTSYWDLWQDWGLMRKDAPPSQKFLRSDLVYQHTWYYYCAMVFDVCFRLLWTLNVSIGEGGLFHSEVLKTILAVAECFRRFVWNFFRLENEHLNNVGQFRAVRDISIVPHPAAPLAEQASCVSHDVPPSQVCTDGRLASAEDDDEDDDYVMEDGAADGRSVASLSASRVSLPPLRTPGGHSVRLAVLRGTRSAVSPSSDGSETEVDVDDGGYSANEQSTIISYVTSL